MTFLICGIFNKHKLTDMENRLVVATSKGVGSGRYGWRGIKKKKKEENSLAVQWLGLSAFTVRPGVWSLIGELRSCMPRGAAKKTKTNLSKKKVLPLKTNQSACKLKPVWILKLPWNFWLCYLTLDNAVVKVNKKMYYFFINF